MAGADGPDLRVELDTSEIPEQQDWADTHQDRYQERDRREYGSGLQGFMNRLDEGRYPHDDQPQRHHQRNNNGQGRYHPGYGDDYSDYDITRMAERRFNSAERLMRRAADRQEEENKAAHQHRAEAKDLLQKINAKVGQVSKRLSDVEKKLNAHISKQTEEQAATQVMQVDVANMMRVNLAMTLEHRMYTDTSDSTPENAMSYIIRLEAVLADIKRYSLLNNHHNAASRADTKDDPELTRRVWSIFTSTGAGWLGSERSTPSDAEIKKLIQTSQSHVQSHRSIDRDDYLHKAEDEANLLSWYGVDRSMIERIYNLFPQEPAMMSDGLLPGYIKTVPHKNIPPLNSVDDERLSQLVTFPIPVTVPAAVDPANVASTSTAVPTDQDGFPIPSPVTAPGTRLPENIDDDAEMKE
jgi:hypothetical protein